MTGDDRWASEAEAFIRQFAERGGEHWDRHPGDLEDVDTTTSAPDDADTQVVITEFPDRHAQSKSEVTVTLGRLVEHIRTTTAPSKERLPLIKFARFGGNKTKAGCVRFDANLLQISGVEADYDGEQISFERAIEIAEKGGLRCIVYTSPSYTAAKPRWRVLAPTERLYPPDQRRRFIDRLNGLYSGCFHPESWTLSQSFYVGSVSPNRHPNPVHRVELIAGEPIDVLHDLDLIAIGRPGSSANGKAPPGDIGTEPREDAELIAAILTGEHYHNELLALAARYLGRGQSPEQAAATLRGVMLGVPQATRDARWPDRYSSINQLVASAGGKFHGNADQRRAIARVTHRLADQCRPAAEIRSAVLAEAERQNLPTTAALALASRILSDKVRAARHAG